MGKSDNANEGQRRRIPGPLGVVASPPAGVGRPRPLLRGPLGLDGVRMLAANAMSGEPLEIHLELSELMELNEVVEHAGSGIDNLFTTVIAHELGHQLGLSHTKSPDDLMFGFGDGNREQRIKWLGLAQKRGLDFRPEQVGVMKGLLAKP